MLSIVYHLMVLLIASNKCIASIINHMFNNYIEEAHHTNSNKLFVD